MSTNDGAQTMDVAAAFLDRRVYCKLGTCQTVAAEHSYRQISIRKPAALHGGAPSGSRMAVPVAIRRALQHAA